MSPRSHPFLARLSLGWILTSLATGAFTVMLQLARAELNLPRALLIVAPAALFIGAASRSASYLVRGRALSAARRVGTLLGLLSAGSVVSLLFALAVLAMRVVVTDTLPGLVELPMLMVVGQVAYLTGAVHQVVTGAASEAKQARDDAVLADLRARDAELGALTAKVNPHFLFNSLNSIAALTTRDPKGARDMCINLATLLRERLSGDVRTVVTLAEELTTIGCYLDIERVRFAERLQYEQQVSEALGGIELPALLLQPLLENAIKHGIARRELGGKVSLTAREQAGLLVLEVTNPLADLPRAKGVGYGLRLIQGRLEVLYQGRASLTCETREGTYVASLRLPLQGPGEPA